MEDDYTGDLDLHKKNDPMFSFDVSNRVIYLKSFSKIFLPGLRIAALVLPDELLSTFLEHKFSRDFATPILSQELLSSFIENGMFSNHIDSVKIIYSNKMEVAKKSCKKYLTSDIYQHLPETGFYFSLKVPKTITSYHLTAALQQKKGFVDDTSRTLLPHEKSKNLIRISIAKTNLTDIETGIKIIAETIQELSEEKPSIFNNWKFYY